MSDSVELLTTDDEGRAVPEPRCLLDLGAVKWLDESNNTRLAYRHKFFRRDKHGQPMRETLVTFLVPDHLCDGAAPSRKALKLVAARMGWN